MRDAGCTLDASALPGRAEAFRRLFRRLTGRESAPRRVVWTFAWSEALEDEARGLSAAELGCCSFFEFTLERRGEELRWTATVPPGQEAALALLDGLAIETPPRRSDRA